MIPTSSQWVALLPLVEKASGKEIVLAALPVLLAVPGILDEVLAATAGLLVVVCIFVLRKYLNSNADRLAQRISSARENGTVSQEDADAALKSLKRLTVSADV